MEQVFEDSASCALELVRGSNSFSDTTPTIWMKGDCWPPYKEIVTRYPLRGAATLNVFVDYVEGPSVLTFGLISPHDRSHMLGIQNKEHLRLTGNLWAWNSENRNIFKKPFDSKTSYGSISQIVQFYDKDIGTGSVLCVYRDPKTNRIHFVINGKKGTVSSSSYAPDFCFGYVYLKSRGSNGEIQVSLQTVVGGGYFEPSTPVIEPAVVVEPVNTNPCFLIRVGQAISKVLSRFLPDLKAKEDHQAPEITQLAHYSINACHPRGICLLINNVPKMVSEAEKQLTNLFKALFFDVHVRRSLQMLQLYEVAQEFAKKNHSKFDSFVVIILSVCQDNDISGVDRKKASLESVMSEFTATNCPTLQGKPKLFFVQRFTFLKLSNVRDGSIQAQCSTDKEIEMEPVFPNVTIGGDNCPEEADFLLTCVTSAVHMTRPGPETLFLQVLIEAIRENRDRYHLLHILTKVNASMADKQRRNGVMAAAQVPCQNHTLRAKVYLGSTPTQVTGSTNPDVAQQSRYKLDNYPRGYCVIINNVNFNEEALNRPGAEKDERSLEQLFKDLFFRVIVKPNLTKHEMERVAEKYGAQTDHSKFQAFVMIVMSHGGDRDCILGVDGRATTVKSLMDEFQESKCPTLRRKPKMFIIQTCRGSLRSSASPAGNVISQAGSLTSAPADNEPCHASLSPESTLPRSVFPRQFDFVMAFATVPGYVSFRSKVDGAFFIQTLVEVIKKHHHTHHFLEILTEVTKRVVEQNSHTKHAVQVPAPTHSMTKLLYL